MNVSEEKQCLGKVKHASRGDAEKHLRNRRIGGLHAYRCGHCNGWHIGHAKGSGGQRRRRGISKPVWCVR